MLLSLQLCRATPGMPSKSKLSMLLAIVRRKPFFLTAFSMPPGKPSSANMFGNAALVECMR